MATKFKIKKGDNVVVTTGRDAGKKGSVLRVIPSENRVLVAGVNMVKRHSKPSMAGPGGIQEKEASIHISNVALADPKTGAATRVGFKTLKDGSKVRVAKKSGETIDA